MGHFWRRRKAFIKRSPWAVKKLKNFVTKDASLNLSDVKRDGYLMNDQERMQEF